MLAGSGTVTYSLQPGMFGQALSTIDGVQPQPPPGGQRPPLEPNVPCETQPVPSLAAPVGVAPQAIHPSMSGAAATAMSHKSKDALRAFVRRLIRQERLPLKVSKPPATVSQATSKLAGVP